MAWTNEQLDAARQRGDPLADETVETIFREGSLDKVRAIFRTLLSNADLTDMGEQTQLPDAVRRYLAQSSVLPAFADPALLRRAADTFLTRPIEVMLALLFSSLPNCYAMHRGVNVLHRTERLAARWAERRVVETAQFVVYVCEEDAFERRPEKRGLLIAQKVRLMHALMRKMLATGHDGRPWDEATLQKPINQEDLAFTLLTFSIVVADAAPLVTAAFDRAEEQAWMHLWAVVGRLIGVEEELIAHDAASARALRRQIIARQWGPGQAGTELTHALIGMSERLFTPRDLDDVLVMGLRRLPAFLVRRMAGSECANHLGVPPEDPDLAELFENGWAPAFRDLRAVDFFHLSEAFIRDFLEDREHKGAKFDLPGSVRDYIDSVPSLKRVSNVNDLRHEAAGFGARAEAYSLRFRGPRGRRFDFSAGGASM